MKITLVVPPNKLGKWILFEDKHSSFGRMIFPYTMAQIYALIEQHIPEAIITVVESQLEKLDEEATLRRLRESEPDIVVTFLSWSRLEEHRVFAETELPTIGVILQQFIDQREAVEKYGLRANWFTKQEIEMPLVEALKEYRDTGDIRETAGFLVYDGEGGYHDTGDAPLADLTKFPMPAFEALGVEKYFALREASKIPEPRKIHFNTMKGCPFKCAFCGQSNRGKAPRMRSAEQVLEQINYLVDNYGVKDFMFFDNEFGVNMERAKDICRGLIEMDTPIQFEINNRVELFDAEFIDLLAKAGCRCVRCGIETCDPVTQAFLNKNIDLERAKKTFAEVRKAGIKVHLYMTPGIPGETKKTLDMNAEFIVDVDADSYTYGALSLMPGSPFYKQYKAEGKILDDDWSRYFSQDTLCYENSSYASWEEVHAAKLYLIDRVAALREERAQKANA